MSSRPLPRKPSGSGRPGSAGATAAGPGMAEDTTTKTTVLKPPTCPLAAEKLKRKKKLKAFEPPPKAYENPAFSIPLKEVQMNPLIIDQEILKTMRRNKPKGEKTKELRRIVTELKDSPDITAVEFIGLVAPYTGDNGDVLRRVLRDDMRTFRAMARKIYDTMMQDVSDVLTNQHIQLRDYEQERTTLYTERMMRAINEIFSYEPNFDFDAYYRDKEGYLSLLFPIPRQIKADSEEAEMYRRQQAFHRLNWLRTEGDRLAKENERLQQRLRELKKEQMDELKGAEQRAKEAEAQREALEAQEEEMLHKLDSLTGKVEKTMIDTEAALRVVTDESNITAPSLKESKAEAARKKRKKQAWVSDAAAAIEETAIEENIVAEGGKVDPKNIGGVIKNVRSKTSKTKMKTPERKPPPSKEKSPFHFSPIKTPPGQPPPSSQKSPFHFSPIKTPPEVRIQREQAAAPPQLHTTRLRTEKVTVRHLGPQPPELLVPPGGGARATPRTSVQQAGPEDVTPVYQRLQTTTPGAPERHGIMEPQRPEHSKYQAPKTPHPMDLKRGRAYAPKDSWGGFG